MSEATSDTPRPTLVMGASGHVGSNLAPFLAARRLPARAVARRLEVLQARAWRGVDTLAADARDPPAWTAPHRAWRLPVSSSSRRPPVLVSRNWTAKALRMSATRLHRPPAVHPACDADRDARHGARPGALQRDRGCLHPPRPGRCRAPDGPGRWVAEFAKLHSRVPAVPMDLPRPQWVQDLGDDPETVFARFDLELLAAASIAQVHRACLHDGTELVVKVRRPGTGEVTEADLRLLERLAAVADNEWPALKPSRPKLLVRQFARSLRREPDLAAECRQAERIASNLTALVVSKVLLDWSGDLAVSQRATLQDEIEAFVDQRHGTALAQLKLGQMLSEVTTILREHRLVLPADLALLIKAFMSLEGMGRGLDPNLHMATEALPLPRQVLRARYQPRAVARWSMSQVMAALIIGASIVMTMGGGPTLPGLPAFGLLGFAAASAGGLWLLHSMWRGGHPHDDDTP